MNKKDSQQGSAVVNVLQSDSIVGVGKECLEIGVDAALESGVLKDIPLVNILFSMFSAVGIARDHIFGNKLLRFLSQLSEISKEERIAMVEKLNEDDKFSGRVGAAMIEILDRMESERKPELAAKCFAAYARAEISFEELRRVLFAIERVPSFDIDKLGKFAKMTMNDSVKLNESLLLSFVNAGFGKNNGGFDGGAIVPTNLCQLFVRVGLAS